MFPTRFLGLNATCKTQLEIEQKYVTHQALAGENNKLEFDNYTLKNTVMARDEQMEEL